MDKSIKINNRKHNELVQKELFRLGYKWVDGDTQVYYSAFGDSHLSILSYGFALSDNAKFATIHLKDLKQMEV